MGENIPDRRTALSRVTEQGTVETQVSLISVTALKLCVPLLRM